MNPKASAKVDAQKDVWSFLPTLAALSKTNENSGGGKEEPRCQW